MPDRWRDGHAGRHHGGTAEFRQGGGYGSGHCLFDPEVHPVPARPIPAGGHRAGAGARRTARCARKQLAGCVPHIRRGRWVRLVESRLFEDGWAPDVLPRGLRLRGRRSSVACLLQFPRRGAGPRLQRLQRLLRRPERFVGAPEDRPVSGRADRRCWRGPLADVTAQARQRPPPCRWGALLSNYSGDDLLSQGATPQVPSAQAGLTSVFGMGTGVTPPLWPPENLLNCGVVPCERSIASTGRFVPSPRPISTGRLNTLLCVHLRPINVVVYHGPYQVNPVGDLILERASHLDAFSAYPFRRSPTSHALGRTTGTRELRPSRSSRTRDSLP